MGLLSAAVKRRLEKKQSSSVARRKAERKKCLNMYPGKNMLWFGGELYIVDKNNNPTARVWEAELIADSCMTGIGLDAARMQPTSQRYSTFHKRNSSLK
jgi:hypothetical protein